MWDGINRNLVKNKRWRINRSRDWLLNNQWRSGTIILWFSKLMIQKFYYNNTKINWS